MTVKRLADYGAMTNFVPGALLSVYMVSPFEPGGALYTQTSADEAAPTPVLPVVSCGDRTIFCLVGYQGEPARIRRRAERPSTQLDVADGGRL